MHYDVVRGDKKIGNINVKRYFQDSIETIDIKSEVSFRIIFSFTVDFGLNESFKNGVLINGNAYNKLNNVTQKESSVEKKSSDYRLVIGGTPNRLSEEKIDFSISEIYMREPKDGEKAFSQHFGKFMQFEKVREHTYKLVSPDGENYYTYENGVCTEIKVYRDYANYSMKIQPESFALVKQGVDSLRTK